MNRLRLAVFLIVMAFSVTLAVIIGTRLSDQALAVIVGVVAGVAASIPTSLIIVWFATRSVSAVQSRPAREADTPRIVVVQPPPVATAAPPPAMADPRYYVPPPAPARERRKFTIIGGDDSSLE
jgi:hypothetical protein